MYAEALWRLGGGSGSGGSGSGGGGGLRSLSPGILRRRRVEVDAFCGRVSIGAAAEGRQWEPGQGRPS